MPKGVYPRPRSKLNWRGAILRFRAGQPLASFLGTEDYPSKGAWHRRLNNDPAFRSRLESVPRTKGHGRRGYGALGAGSAVDWDAVFAHIRSGGEIKEKLGTPGWPRKGQWMGRLMTDPSFAEKVRLARLDRPRAWLRLRATDSSKRTPVFIIAIRNDLMEPGKGATISTGYELHERDLAEAALADYLAGLPPRIRKRKTGVPPKTEGDWAAAMMIVRSGKPITAYLGKNGLPSEHQWSRRLKSEPAFAAEVEAARGEGFEAIKRLGLRPPRGPGVKIPDATWERFLSALPEAGSVRALSSRRDMPNEKAVSLRCSRDPAFKARLEAAAGWTRRDGHVVRFSHDDYEQALRAVESGRLAMTLGDGLLPSNDAIRKYGKDKPEFLARWRVATTANRTRGSVMARSPKRRIQVRATGGELFVAVERLIPPQWPADMRDEVRGAMVADILEGVVTLADLPNRLVEYRRDYFSGGPDRWGSVSLDSPLSHGDRRTLHDVYAR